MDERPAQEALIAMKHSRQANLLDPVTQRGEAVSARRTAVSGRLNNTTRNARTAAPASAHFISRVRPGPFSPSGRMNSEQSVGLITSPTNSEQLSVIISVLGR